MLSSHLFFCRTLLFPLSLYPERSSLLRREQTILVFGFWPRSAIMAIRIFLRMYSVYSVQMHLLPKNTETHVQMHSNSIDRLGNSLSLLCYQQPMPCLKSKYSSCRNLIRLQIHLFNSSLKRRTRQPPLVLACLWKIKVVLNLFVNI